MKNPYAGHGHGFYQNLGQQPNFSWQPGASQTPGPFFPGYHQQPKLPFLETLHFPYLTRLLNDPIYHDTLASYANKVSFVHPKVRSQA
jgi:hypothetical protein